MIINPIITYQSTKINIAIADIVSFDLAHKKTIQSLAVRQLFCWLQNQLQLSGTLIEDAFPYHFFQGDTKFFVCFSHSQNKVAVVLGRQRCAIDIELRRIKKSITDRFFHPDETLLLSTKSLPEQTFFRTILWQYKENKVKLYGNTLIFWLKQNHTSILNQIQSNHDIQILLDENKQTFLVHPAYGYSVLY